MAAPLILILLGVLGLYASYLHYHDALEPGQRGVHNPGPGMIRVYGIEGVRLYQQYIGQEITRNEWIRRTGREA